MLAAILFSGLSPAWSAPQQQLTLRVAINAPACNINQGQAINVDFGNDIFITQVNGENYKQPISFSLSCNAYTPVTMRLRFDGTTAQFDAGVLATTMSDLGIKLLQGSGGGTPLSPGSWLNFDRTAGIPSLQAVLVQRAGSTLAAGEFTGTATLVVEHI
ncbi:fimbrial protein [Erwiniaceae bacterium BAC15a-03b]|uniref:Fimbrial protein n=1 Tax=Winslowiella arboricola TaxID=2978220 RepID=A0A9J6PPE3_9GAMM|nr:fimbrial protein [Winslowiella arboricola]MCU5771609.1 fimbrial protein [Winslowiella arboricola]MCU5775919.1 fimbrial protein [Winslowiella arboricola]